MRGNEVFELVTERGWRRGYGNMLRSGLAGWFKTRTWWVNSLIWGAVVTGMLGRFAFSRPGVISLGSIMRTFSETAGLIPAVGVIIALQDALVSEKRRGTAAWVLSKPLTREGFLVSKVVSNSLGVLVSMVAVPMILGYILMSIIQRSLLNPIGFLGCVFLFFVIDFFFLSFTLMLGALFSSRAPVIGIPLAVFFLYLYMIGQLPALRFILPMSLIYTPDNLANALLMHTSIQQEQLLILGIILLECVFFLSVALWRFNRQEF